MTPIRLLSLVRLPDGTTSALGTPPPDRFQRYDLALAHGAATARRHADADRQHRPGLPARRLRQPVRCARLCGAWRDRAQFLRRARKAPEQPALSRPAGPGAGLRPPPDRRRRGARRASGAGRRHLAGLLHGLLRRAVCRRRAGAGRDAGRARRQAQSYIEQLRSQIKAAGASAVVAPDEPRRVRANGGRGHRGAGSPARWRRFNALPESPVELRPLSAPASACYIQFSSGSTRLPRGIDIRQDQLMANIDGSLAAQEVDATDSGVSWLPLYHDMGLIGFVLAPMCAQRSVDLLAPRRFRAPAAAVAVADLATPRHHHLQPELRLRPGRPPRAEPAAGRASICPPCDWPASAPT